MTRFRVMFIALVVIFICLESFLRIGVLMKNKSTTIKLSKNIFYTTKGAFRLYPDLNQRIKQREINFIVSSNSHGLRDKNYLVISKGRRIVVIGDSFTFGYGVGNEEAYPKVIERELLIEVINGGMAGNSLFDNIEFLKEILTYYETDYVLMGLHAGDVGESSKEMGLSTPAPIEPQRPKFINIKELLRRRFLSYSFIARNLKSNKITAAILTKLNIVKSLKVYTSQPKKEFECGVLDDLLDRYKEVCGDVTPMLFFIPDKWNVYSGSKEINTILKKKCEERGIIFINICNDLAEIPNADIRLYFDWDYHFNVYGNLIVGKLLAERIII